MTRFQFMLNPVRAFAAHHTLRIPLGFSKSQTADAPPVIALHAGQPASMPDWCLTHKRTPMMASGPKSRVRSDITAHLIGVPSNAERLFL